jgi:hypothetical protein
MLPLRAHDPRPQARAFPVESRYRRRAVRAGGSLDSGLCHEALGALGLGPRDVRIHINNRQVVAYLLCELGVPPEQHVDVFMVLDKKGKVPVETMKEMLVEKGWPPRRPMT